MNFAEHVDQGSGAAETVVRCLGRFRVEDLSGDKRPIRTRKARAVLAALAMSGRSMSRDALADLLWSDRGAVQARSSLRQAVFDLQHVASGGEPILAIHGNELAIRPERLVTDLQLIRAAAGDGDWPHLMSLLAKSEEGLLSDLDGLDPEFDSWLRIERAQEPDRTLSLVTAAAERCLAQDGPRAALDIVSEVLRLDPVNEAAVRLALRIDDRLADRAALHRHYAALKSRLREDYEADPSLETRALFERLAAGGESRRHDAPDAVAAAAADRVLPPAEPSTASRRPAALIALAALVAAVAALAFLSWRDGEGSASPGGPLVLAVLPFEQQGSGDAYLAEGLWDDTRSALSRNAQLRVLGRTTARSIAAENLTPQEYRRRLGVDYVLEGSVRRGGDEVIVSAALTRTLDGVAIWEDAFRARLGDPFAMQEAIARGIEGRLRGRLATGGGRRADQIATSPEVYALYSEATSLLHARWSVSARRAQLLLRKAVALDPNYAPAWAGLAETEHFIDYGAGAVADRRARGLAYAGRALALAPRLAQAHAIHAFYLGDGSAGAESELRLAVKLDPSHVEAWNWLGNTLMRHYRFREATQAYEQAVVLDPAWMPSASNLVAQYAEIGDRRGFERVRARVARAGADAGGILTLAIQYAEARGDLSEAAAIYFRLGRGDRRREWADFEAGRTLMALGYLKQGLKLTGYPADFADMLEGKRLPADTFGGVPVSPRDVWLNEEYAAPTARAFVNLGRERDLVRRYRQAFASTDEAISKLTDIGGLSSAAPTLAVALRRSGDADAADRLLAAAEGPLERAGGGRITYAEARWSLGRIRAAEGRTDEALPLLNSSIRSGWLPNAITYPTDMAQDPAFHGLRGDPRFEALRRRILAHIARERAELGPVKV